MALWGGRFEGGGGGQDPLFKRFNDSLRFDARLVMADIAGSKAWAAAIANAGVLTADEERRLLAALDDVGQEAQRLRDGIIASGEEDVHSWVEAQLIQRVGDLGKKLHTGRSRNDQVATDLRMYLGGVVRYAVEAIRELQREFVAFAAREIGDDRTPPTVVPGYTHLQRGQPVLLSHWAMAYFEMLERDVGRFGSALERMAASPLGCGALAGTAYPIDREALARSMGFSHACRNSLDAVSDRDFVLETLAAAVACAVHLSRLGEDLVLYCTSEFGFVRLSDAVTSGSSLMPQKKNPDAMELIRGKTGRILGSFVALSTTLKGLPLAYNKDLQEDKEPVFDAMEHLLGCLKISSVVVRGMTVDREACRRAALGDGTVLSTDLADYLVSKGLPFRDAHHASGQVVRAALERNAGLHELPLLELQRAAGDQAGALIKGDVFSWLTLEASVARRAALGGTAPDRVREAIAAAKAYLDDGQQQ